MNCQRSVRRKTARSVNSFDAFDFVWRSHTERRKRGTKRKNVLCYDVMCAGLALNTPSICLPLLVCVCVCVLQMLARTW